MLYNRENIITRETHRTDINRSKVERQDEKESEETKPKRAYSTVDQLRVDMITEHYHPIDVHVIVSQNVDHPPVDVTTEYHHSIDTHRSVSHDDGAGNVLTSSTNTMNNDSRRIISGTFSAGADEAPETVNVVFCDCPGINENEESFEPTLDNVDTSHGIILVIDAYKSNAGIEERKVLKLLQRIQERLHKQGVMLQNVPLLCVCNKMDTLDDKTKQEVKDTVRKIVDDTFPTTQDIPVRFFGARKLLEEPNDCKKVTDELQAFLKHSLYSAVMKQHMWMLNLLDLSITIRTEKRRLAQCLENLHNDKCKEAINLFQQVNDVEINSVEKIACRNQMKQYLSSRINDFKILWSPDEADKLIQQRHAGWNLIRDKVDKEILRQLNLKIETNRHLSEFRSLKNKYIKLRKAAYEPFQKQLDPLKKSMAHRENTSQILKDLAIPFAAQGAAITVSRFVPHHGMALAAPLIGLLLLGYGAFEEYRDWQDDKQKASFENDRQGYLVSRTNEKINELLKDLSDEGDEEKRYSKLSDTYRAIFGESIRKQILDELSIIIQNCLTGNTLVSQIKQGQQKKNTSDEYRGKLSDKFKDIHKSVLNSCRLKTTEVSDFGTEDMPFGDYVRQLYHQKNEPVHVIVKSCTTMKSGTETSNQLKLCGEYLFSCSRTSRNHQTNILSLREARMLNVDDSPPELYLIYEDCQCSLARFIADNPFAKDRRQRRRQEEEFFELGLQIIQAIHYLHSRCVIHGNLIPENIMLKESNNEWMVKLGSIGIPGHIWFVTDENHYVPQELVVRPNVSPSQESDICSLGFILLELWYRKTVQDLRKHGNNLPKIMDKNVRHILIGCLQQDSNKRWKSNTLLGIFRRCLYGE